MGRERLLIIGGVAAGMSAASRARRHNPQMEIIVLEKGAHVSYGACGLPYHLSGKIADWKDLIVYTPEYFREKRDIDVRLHHEATEIVPGRKLVRALRAGSVPVELAYDKLVVATGGAPTLTIPGADLHGVFTCNDLAGTIHLREFLDEKHPSRAVIVGAGYIAFECAEAFRSRGISVTILERSDAPLEDISSEIAAQIEGTLARHNVAIRKSSAVSSITRNESTGELHLHHASGSEPADVVLLATGIAPRCAFAEAAGISCGTTGAITVDDRQQTNVPSIYAAGDCAEARHLVTGKPAYVPLGTTANKQGRVAGENAAGGNARFAGIVGTMVTKVFELEVAKTGLGISESRRSGFSPDSVTITSTSRAHYMHGRPIVVTLIWDRASERLLGCQMCGEEGVAKRIDVAAMALHARMRVPDMLHLDLSYAPPFAPVWEPILIAASEAMKKMRRS
ncbi:MAG TPA: FAD-dependent oxidoreductase [Candidatus Acidoferrales bacterium]|nr:FAD-dependent oxidoreductase [Candidatus Acidoferrales bacterium]